ncbi:Casparian strip membrane protein domain [Dillenia turbinata]|uniref:CASP-like protein n=1 Tax=Dillenia turbinata TaxID=194707 RepID=A0AAN8VZU3_9MAGN
MAMNVSRQAVHPIEAPPPLTNDMPPPLLMKDIEGMPGTRGGLLLRFCQFVCAVISLVVMGTTNDFPSVTAFCYLVAAVSLQSLWSFSLAVIDIYALLVKRSLRNPKVVSFFAFGDGSYCLMKLLDGVFRGCFDGLVRFRVCVLAILVFLCLFCRFCLLLSKKKKKKRLSQITSTLTFAAACASAGITVLIGNDLNLCAINHCTKFESATAMAFMSWFLVIPSFLMNFWSLASKGSP